MALGPEVKISGVSTNTKYQFHGCGHEGITAVGRRFRDLHSRAARKERGRLGSLVWLCLFDA